MSECAQFSLRRPRLINDGPVNVVIRSLEHNALTLRLRVAKGKGDGVVGCIGRVRLAVDPGGGPVVGYGKGSGVVDCI